MELSWEFGNQMVFIVICNFAAVSVLLKSSRATNSEGLGLALHPVFCLVSEAVAAWRTRSNVGRTDDAQLAQATIAYLHSLQHHLKSGFSIKDAILYSCSRAKHGISAQAVKELFTTLQMRLERGMGVSQALVDLSSHSTHRIAAPQLCLAFQSLGFALSVGGDQIALIERMKERIEKEIRLRDQLKVSTAQMRLQVKILVWAPFVLWGVIACVNPSSATYFFGSHARFALLLCALGCMMTGVFLIKRIERRTLP